MSLTASEAAKLVGMSKPGLLKAIRQGRVSAEKDANGEWRIEPVELFRVYAPASKAEGKPVETSLPQSYQEDTVGLRVENEQLKQRLSDKDDVIADLRQRLDSETDERRKLTLILTDTQTSLPWWRRIFRGR